MADTNPGGAPEAERPRILTAGELLVEFIAERRDTRHRTVTPYLGPYPSGAPAIFIDQAARLGARAAMVGAVGADAFGDVVCERLAADGVDGRWINRLEGETTGTAFVAYQSSGAREFIFHLPRSAATGFAASEAVLAAIAEQPPDVVHVSGSILGDERAGGAVVAIARAAMDAGARLSFDPNARPELMGEHGRARLDELLRRAAVLFPSDEDMAALRPGVDPEQVMDEWLAGGTERVVLTRGEAGAVYRDADRRIEQPALAVECVDPTGAGDCFSATFITLIARGWDPERALRYAGAAGALAVTVSGPMEGNSSLAAIEQRLRNEDQ